MEPLDLSTVRKQIVLGQYESLEAFDKDMLRVFLSAEVHLFVCLTPDKATYYKYYIALCHITIYYVILKCM